MGICAELTVSAGSRAYLGQRRMVCFKVSETLGQSHHMTTSCLKNLPRPMEAFAADPNLREILVPSPQSSRRDFLASLGEGVREGVLESTQSNESFLQQSAEVPKSQWSKPVPNRPLWMLEQPSYAIPGVAASGCGTKSPSIYSSADSTPWRDRNGKASGTSKIEGDCHNDAAPLVKTGKEKSWIRVDAPTAAAPADSISPKGFVICKDSSDMDVKQIDSSDCSDHMDEPEDNKGMNRTVSKNLVSERKRRKKLNEGLYTLRALVPRISKMDKASIIGDAIDYVRELQKEVEDLQAAILEVESARTGVSMAGEDQPVPVQLTGAPPVGLSWDEEGSKTSEEGASENSTPILGDDTAMPPAEQRILEFDVAKLEENNFHLKIFCTKGPGVFVQLMRSLEALGLEFLSANLTSFEENILNTFIAEIKDFEKMKAEEVKVAILEVAARFGLQTS